MVTKPMRGSLTSRSSRRATSSRIRSASRSVRVLIGASGSGQVLDVAAQDLARCAPLDLLLDGREGLLQRGVRRGDAHDPQRGPLPQVLVLDLGDRDVVMLAQPVLEAAQDHALLLEGA